MQILESSPFVKTESIEKTGSYTLGAIEAYWEAARGGVVIGLQDGLVRDITLNPPYRLTLGEVVEKFGPPEALLAGMAGVPEHPWWGISIYYPTMGTDFGIGDEQFQDPSLESSTQIRAVTFVAPQSSLEGLLAELHGSQTEDYLKHIRPWRGYGRIFGVYYDSLQDAMQ